MSAILVRPLEVSTRGKTKAADVLSSLAASIENMAGNGGERGVSAATLQDLVLTCDRALLGPSDDVLPIGAAGRRLSVDQETAASVVNSKLLTSISRTARATCNILTLTLTLTLTL